MESLSSSEFVDVYRIEKRGRGPYNDTSWGAGAFMANGLPCPINDWGLPEDVVDWEIRKYRFGAPTPEALKEWIAYPASLGRLGYKVSHYRAKKKYTHSSEIQSMFIKRHAKKVNEWDVATFCKDNHLE